MEEQQEVAVREATPVAPRNRPPVVVPRTIQDQLQMAQAIIRSGLAPASYKNAEAVVVALQMGAELGLLPMQSLRLITVISGKPTLSADGCAAVVQASGVCEYLYVEELTAKHCTMVTKRRGYPQPQRYTYTIDQAKAAKLVDRSPVWQSYPERLLKARAQSYLCRDVYADVIGGLLSSEELEDIGDAPPPLKAPRNVPVEDAAAEVAALRDACNELGLDEAVVAEAVGKVDSFTQLDAHGRQRVLRRLAATRTARQQEAREAADVEIVE